MNKSITRVLRKGVIVIPKGVREKARLEEGDIVVVREEGGKVIIERLENKVVKVDLDLGEVEDLLKSIKEEESREEMERYGRILKASARY